MPFLKSTPLEDRGADIDNTRETSLRGDELVAKVKRDLDKELSRILIEELESIREKRRQP